MSEKRIIPNEIMLPEVTRLLSEGNSVIIMTKGTSMLPFIIGDRDSVELVAKGKYVAGDIVLAKIAESRWVLHRIIDISGENVLLKGDGNLDSTERCTVGDVAGAVRFIIGPRGRKKDASAPGFVRRSGCWRKLPRIVRRYSLGVFRRIIKLI